MLQSRIEPRPQTCRTCNHPNVHPRVMKVQRGKDIITEAHWICPRCSSRFMVGTVNIESSEKKN